MKAKTNRFIFRWHRRIGIASAVFVIVLCVTGLLLMFTNGLGLDRKHIGGGLIAKVYNLAPDTDPVGVKLADGSWVVMIDDLVYVGDGMPLSLAPPLQGVAQINDMVFVKGGTETLETLFDGRLVERSNNTDTTGVDYVRPSPVPKSMRRTYIEKYAGRGLPASRVLLDIHTGRFFGAIGSWVMIAATLLLLLLSISGIIMWSGLFKHKGKYKRRW